MNRKTKLENRRENVEKKRNKVEWIEKKGRKKRDGESQREREIDLNHPNVKLGMFLV